MKKPIIFTDLDGTLLDAKTYSFEPALPALTLIKKNNIPLIVCSSKTKTEIEYYRKRLDNHHPFISENGGGIFIPESSKLKVQSLKFKVIAENDYYVVRLGARYTDLRRVITELREEGFDIKGFGNMTVEEVAEVAGMGIEEAEMAKERDFDEPFIFEGNEKRSEELLTAIEERGFNYIEGRFFHILGNSDKGKAISILIDLYRRKFGEVATVAIGDSPNDIPMLEKVDYPVIVRKPDGSYDSRMDIPNLIRAEGIGSAGWNETVINLLKTMA